MVRSDASGGAVHDTCSGGHFRQVRDKGQNENLLMFKDQNTRRITLCRFWTSRRPRVRLKRKCIDLGCKEHGFHKVTWSANNHKKSAKLIGFILNGEVIEDRAPARPRWRVRAIASGCKLMKAKMGISRFRAKA
ncbi:hypothetical protein PIB30_061417 [Stylosanthes scabra]|uniref:Uncharacterized protein n=1 Tax=Stylosanthes scabra TaxID=79078 RepID=A0ABU6XJS1_9FABA|nr:hypothetical protein [Stylosanthes scabra]